MSARPPLEGESVAVSGYASLFATPDDARDLVVRGAFRRSLSERGASGIRFLWQQLL